MRAALLKRHLLHLIVLAVLVAIVLALHLLPIGDDDWLSRDVLDIGHVLGFATLAFIVARTLQRGAHRENRAWVRPYFQAGLLTFGISVLAEALQVPAQRDASLGDLIRDFCGIVSGLLVAEAMGRRAWSRLRLAATAAALVSAAILSPAAVLLAKMSAHLRFPVLVGFESVLDRALYHPILAAIDIVPAPESWGSTGSVGRVRLNGRRKYGGISFVGLPSNWTNYRALVFSASALSTDHAVLFVRVNDAPYDSNYGDRFNERFEIGRSPTTVRISLSEVQTGPQFRLMDLTNIRDITVFMETGEEAGFYIDDLHLE